MTRFKPGVYQGPTLMVEGRIDAFLWPLWPVRAGVMRAVDYVNTHRYVHVTALARQLHALSQTHACLTRVWVKIKPPGIGPQVLVLVSIYQGSIVDTYY